MTGETVKVLFCKMYIGLCPYRHPIIGMTTAADMTGNAIIPCMGGKVKFVIFIKPATPGFWAVYMAVATTGMTAGTILFITIPDFFRNHIKRLNAKAQSHTFFLSPTLLMQAVMCSLQLIGMTAAIFFGKG